MGKKLGSESMVKRKLSKQIIEQEPYLVWNSFIDILAMEPEHNLSDIQKVAQRTWWYDSEVQNGGHLQYFENSSEKDYRTVIESLIAIGAKDHVDILIKASEQYLRKKRRSIKTVLQFVKKAKEGEFDHYDFRYYEVKPDMNHYLEEYLNTYQNDFIEFEE